MPKPRFSRWGRSAYERDVDLQAEQEALAQLVQPVGFCHDAEVVAVNSKTQVNDALLEKMPSVQLLVTTTSGYDHLDLAALKRRNVLAARLPNVRRDAVVESALGMMLDFVRRHDVLRHDAGRGQWSRSALPSLGLKTLRGGCVGVIGCGVIGRRMTDVLKMLGADVVGVDPAGLPAGVREQSIDDMVQQCDVVTLHCHLTPETRNIIDADRLRRAQPNLIIINTARGELLDVEAAVGAIRQGRLGGLGVDVFPREPWPAMSQQAWGKRILFTPHASGFHDGLSDGIARDLHHVVTAYLAEKPLPWQIELP